MHRIQWKGGNPTRTDQVALGRKHTLEGSNQWFNTSKDVVQLCFFNSQNML